MKSVPFCTIFLLLYPLLQKYFLPALCTHGASQTDLQQFREIFFPSSYLSNQWRGRFLQKVIQSHKTSILTPGLALYAYTGCGNHLGRLAFPDCSYLLGTSSSVPYSVTSCPAVQVRAQAASVCAELLLLEVLYPPQGLGSISLF